MTVNLLRDWSRSEGSERDRLIQQVVELNMPVARLLARHYAGRGIPLPDLEQVAYLGLVSAARRYDPDRGEDFLAYAVPTIKGELRKTFRDLGWMVRPPRRFQELQAQVWALEPELAQSLGRSPTPSEVAERLGVETDQVVEVLAMDGCFAPRSLDAPVGDDDATTFADHQGELDPEFARGEARAMLAPAMRRLGGRDRRIVELRFFRGLTQQQIGEEIGVTQMQVSRLLSRILADLRTDIAGRRSSAA